MSTAPIPPDPEGFRQLFDRQAPAVHRFLVRLTRDAHAAEDLLQETFATLWRKRAQFRGDGSLEGYLRQIAYRTWLNARATLRRARAVAPLDVDPSSSAETAAEGVARDLDRREALASVRRAVDALPEGWREPFVLFRYEGLSCTEIAEAMALSPKAVELRLARAMKEVVSRVAPHRLNGSAAKSPSRPEWPSRPD